MSKKSKSAVQRRHQSEEIEHFMRFVKEYNEESDRAAVILAASKLDELLYQLLSASLMPSSSSRDELLDNDRPLGTFSSRIAISYRLGLIDEGLTRALHLVRRIRNAFAHQLTGTKLDGGPEADRVRELVTPLRGFVNYDDLRRLGADTHSGLSGEFRATVALICLRLLGGISRATRLEGERLSLEPPTWERRKDSESDAESESESDAESESGSN